MTTGTAQPRRGWALCQAATVSVALVLAVAALPARSAPGLPAAAATPSSVAAQEEILALEDIAQLLHDDGKAVLAIDPARQAVALRRAQSASRNQRLGLALALSNLGQFLLDAERWTDAEAVLQEALRLRRANLPAKDTAIASSLHKLGALYELTGHQALAFSAYLQAERMAAAAAPNSLVHASILRDLGATLAARGDVDAARTRLAHAMGILRLLGDDGVLANELRARTVLEQAALAHRAGQQADAGSLFEEAVALYRQASGVRRVGLATALIGASSWARATGRWNSALTMLREAVAVSRALRGERHTDVARADQALADMLRLAGDHAAAAALAQLALDLRRELLPPVHPDIAASQDLLALILLEAGRPADALREARQASQLWEHLPDSRLWLAASLHNQGAALFQMGQWQPARQTFLRALRLRLSLLGPRHPAVATTRNQLAECLDMLGQHRAAGVEFDTALGALLAHANAPLETAMALARYADHVARRGDRDGGGALAIFLGKQAVNQLQGLRADLAGGDPALQQSFVAGREDVYQRLSARLLDAGRLAEAEQVHRMLKEDELRQFTRGESNGAATQATLAGAEPALARDWNQLAQGLAALGRQVRQLQISTISDERAEAERRLQLRELGAQVRDSSKRFQTFIAETRRQLSGRDDASLQEATLAATESVQGRLKALPGSGTVLVHYVQLEQELRVVLTTQTVVIPRVVKVSREQLNQVIGRFRSQIFQRDPGVQATARQLYDWLIGPIAADLETWAAQTVLLSLSGTMRYLPFAALHDGRGWFIERYAPVMVTLGVAAGVGGGSGAAAAGGAERAWSGSGFGLTRAVPGFQPLPAVRRELSGIIGPTGLSGAVRLDADFNFDNLQAALDDGPRVLHIATHVVFRPGTEDESYMLLGDGKNLSLADFRTLPLEGLELLTLSACDTAVGGGLNANGREIEGFAGAARSKGTAAVMATLWPVADDSTAELMQRFYRGWQAEAGISKARALRNAQLALLRGAATGAGDARGAARMGQPAAADAAGAAAAAATQAHPYFWAPFVLLGGVE